MEVRWALLVLIITTTTGAAVGEEHNDLSFDNVDDRTRLFRDLMRGYEKTINPDNTEFTFGISLIDVDFLDKTSYLQEKNYNAVEVNVLLRFVWKDNRLVWDEADYGGASVLRVESDIFWKPDMTLFNNLDVSRTSSCWNPRILVYPTGDLLWIPACRFRAFCKSNLSLDPYEPQTCSLKFGSWTYDGAVLDVNLNNKEQSVDLSEFTPTSDWTVVNATSVKNILFYACCNEPYVDLVFNITIKRKPESEIICTA